jgi:hypothetical protein
VPGIPKLSVTPFLPMVIRAPFVPTDIETPDLLRLRYMPLASLTRFLNCSGMALFYVLPVSAYTQYSKCIQAELQVKEKRMQRHHSVCNIAREVDLALCTIIDP